MVRYYTAMLIDLVAWKDVCNVATLADADISL
jgi:hypothetical protein